MWWWLTAGCFLISDADIRQHNRALAADADTGAELLHLTLLGEHLDAFKAWPVLAVVLDGQEVVSAGDDTVRKGGFEIAFPDPLELDLKYKVDVLIDGDGDGICDPYAYYSTYGYGYGSDALFRIKAVESDEPGRLEVVLDRDHDADGMACGSFPGNYD